MKTARPARLPAPTISPTSPRYPAPIPPAPFILGDVETLLSLFAEAGIPDAQIRTQDGRVHFPSIESWVHTDVKGWTLADMIDDEQYELLRREASVEMKRFVQSDGTVAFRSSAHIVTAAKT